MKNIKFKLLISIFIILLIVIISNISFAGVSVNGGAYVNITVDNAFLACLYMRNGGTSTLGANKLDPHLKTVLDDGAATYLGTSMYGKIKSGKIGVSVNLTSENSASNTNKNYYSSTGNPSGVMKNLEYEYLAGLADVSPNINTQIMKSYLDKNSKYINKLSETYTVENTRGMSIKEVEGWSNTTTDNVSEFRPVFQRSSGFLAYYSGTGVAGGNCGFRPVIWNINAD